MIKITGRLEQEVNHEFNERRDYICANLMSNLRVSPNQRDKKNPMSVGTTIEQPLDDGTFLEYGIYAAGSWSDEQPELTLDEAISAHERQCKAALHDVEVGTEPLNINSKIQIVDTGEGAVSLHFRSFTREISRGCRSKT